MAEGVFAEPRGSALAGDHLFGGFRAGLRGFADRREGSASRRSASVAARRLSDSTKSAAA